MGRRARIALTRSLVASMAGIALLVGTAATADAEGLIVDRVQAKFGVNRKGHANHSVKLRGTVVDTTSLRSFRPDLSGLQVRIGDFVAVTHNPTPEGGDLRSRKGVWKLKTKVNGTVTKLRLDTRSGAIRLDVKKTNASLLQAGGPEYALIRLDVGTKVLDDAVVFDERRRGGAVQWKSLARGSVIVPPDPKPGGDPKPAGTIPFTILSRGEQSDVLMPMVTLARTQQEWEALYARAIFTVPNQRPSVDFTQEMVVGIFTGYVSQVRKQEIDVTAVTDIGTQLQVTWRAHMLCGSFTCTGDLQNTQCPDFSPFLFIRVRRVQASAVSNKAPTVSDDCP